MIISKTPFRVSFFGGSTDMPEFFMENGGAVLSTSIDKYCYVNVRHLPRFFDYTTELSYATIERVTDVNQVRHPLIRNAMTMLDMHEIRLTYEADLPARTGLGTSSSFAVGMLNAFYGLKGKYVDKRRLADEAIYLERTLCAEAGGLQDQIAAAFGGLNKIEFSKDGYQVNPIIIAPERKHLLEQSLMLFYTGVSRFSADIQTQTEQAIRKADKQAQLRHMLELVTEAEDILASKTDLSEFGRLLHETWTLKRGISAGITTDMVDAIYQKAVDAGAIGGKLLGAGGGGFLLFYVEPERQAVVREALRELIYVPITFDSVGTQIMYYQPEFYDLDHSREIGTKGECAQ